MNRRARTQRPRAVLGALALVAALGGCAPADGDGGPRLPFWMRIVCAVERMVQSGDMRVREPSDRCAQASRQIEAGQQRLREAVGEAIPEEEPADPDNPQSPSE